MRLNNNGLIRPVTLIAGLIVIAFVVILLVNHDNRPLVPDSEFEKQLKEILK